MQSLKEKITASEKDPLGEMMHDYLEGDPHAFLTVESDTLEMWKMTGETMFRTFGTMNRIERKALSLCRGEILDIGAGAGCHTLYLQSKNKTVTALDQSPGSVKVMEKRGVKNARHENLFSVKNKKFDTLLMLMNGIGITGSLDGLNLFFQFADTLLADNGQILADSTDLAGLYGPDLTGSPPGNYYGETRFIMTYKTMVSDPFDWLYIDFDTLQYHAGLHGFQCTKQMADKTGKYLTRIDKKA